MGAVVPSPWTALVAKACGLNAGCLTASTRKKAAGAISTRSERLPQMAEAARGRTVATGRASLLVMITNVIVSTAGTAKSAKLTAQGVVAP